MIEGIRLLKGLRVTFDSLFTLGKNIDMWRGCATFAFMREECLKFGSVWEDLGFYSDESVNFEMALDQSTRNTGIFLKALDNSVVYMMELRRDTGETAEEYIMKLENLLVEIGQGRHIVKLVYERPIKAKNFRSTQVLFHLEGMIKQLPLRYDCYTGVYMDSIPVTAWRSAVMLENFKDYDVKEGVKYSLCRIFNWIGEYGLSLSKDNDVYDAAGIMFGDLVRAVGEDNKGDLLRQRGHFISVVECGDKVAQVFDNGGIREEEGLLMTFDYNMEAILRLVDSKSYIIVRFKKLEDWNYFCWRYRIYKWCGNDISRIYIRVEPEVKQLQRIIELHPKEHVPSCVITDELVEDFERREFIRCDMVGDKYLQCGIV